MAGGAPAARDKKHEKVESQFLRVRCTKIGLADFRTVKVIGKGAFDEVRAGHHYVLAISTSHRSCRCAWCRRSTWRGRTR